MSRIPKPRAPGAFLSLVPLCSLLATTPLLAVEGAPGACLAFACDGTAREQRVLHEQSATWIINQTRAFAPTLGRVVYRVPVGSAQLERLLALLIHVAAVVMILRALVDRKWQWFGVSFAYKSAVDGVAAWLLLSGTSLNSSPWLTDCLCFAPFALIGVWVLLKLKAEVGPWATDHRLLTTD